MKNIIFLLVIILFLLQSCICNKNKYSNTSNKASLEEVAKHQFGDGFKIIYNNTKEYALITKSHKELTQPIPDLMYSVYSLKTKENIISDTLTAGDVYWLNDFVIRATIREQKAESRRRMYTYDVKSQEFILD